MNEPIAKKAYYSIGEVCNLTGLKPHVLRYWETQFEVLSPTKNRAGNRVFRPKEIELILDTLPGVTESAVIGIAHPDFGEGVVAILVGTNPPAEQQVREMIEDQIARFKQPKKVFHLQQLPRNSMGKVQKNILREQYADCFRPDNQTGDQS